MIALLSLFISSAWGMNCHTRFVDWRNPRSICTEWARGDEVLSSFKLDTVDYVIPNPLKSAEVSVGSVDRMKRDFNLLVKTMTEQVAGEKANGSLNAPQRFLVARLSAVKLEALLSRDPLCAPGSQINARYSERTNSIQLCPAVTRLPLAAWLPMVAHELGHLADPCNFRQGFAYTERVPRSSEDVRKAVRECNAQDVAETMADGDHRADRAIAITPASKSAVRKAIAKLVSCGLLRPLSDPEMPATYDGHPYFAELKSAARSAGVELKADSQVSAVSGLCESSKADKENAADLIGFRVLAAFLREHPIGSHGEWITYFYASVNCSPAEHTSSESGYASSSERMASLLRVPGVKSLAKCE